MSHEILFYDDTHQYIVDGQEVPSVTTILNYMSDVEYGKVNPSVLEQASKRGSLVHEYTELMDCGAVPDEIEYEVAGYLKAYKDFLRDYKPDWKGIEMPVYEEVYNYVGTLDRYGMIDGKLCIVDIKTVSSPTKMQKLTTCAQTIAYAQALYSMTRELIETRYALYLKSDGEYNLVDLSEYEAKYRYNSWNMFCECRKLYQHIQEIKDLKPIKKGKNNGK